MARPGQFYDLREAIAPLIYACIHLHMPTVRKSDVEILNIVERPLDAHSNGCSNTVSQGIRTLDSRCKTGAFHRTPLTTGYTACSLNAVLLVCRSNKVTYEHHTMQ